MAMEFGRVSKVTVGEIVTNTATEGGAVIGGLLGSGALGKQIEKLIKPDVLPGSNVLDKLMAWSGNNIPKVVMWYMMKKEGKKFLGEYSDDVAKGVLGSVVLDTLIRADNSFAPKAAISLFGIDVLGDKTLASNPQIQENMQKVLQENSSLRQQLNNTLQRMASVPVPSRNVTNVQSSRDVQLTPPPDHDRAYGMMSSPEERRKEYGTMTPPIEAERNRKYSAMNKAKLNFAGETDSVATTFGML